MRTDANGVKGSNIWIILQTSFIDGPSLLSSLARGDNECKQRRARGRGEVNIWREGDGLLGGGGISISDATHNRFDRCLWNGFDASLLNRRTLLHSLTL